MNFLLVVKNISDRSRFRFFFQKENWDLSYLMDISAVELCKKIQEPQVEKIFTFDITDEDLKAKSVSTISKQVISLHAGTKTDAELISYMKRLIAVSGTGSNTLKSTKKNKQEVVIVGASTGGPEAIAKLLSMLQPYRGIPILVTVHMPKEFVPNFAKRLGEKTSWSVKVAENGIPIDRADVWIAPGDYHMEIRGGDLGCILHLNQEPPVHSCRPAVDMLFRSAAQCQYVTGTALLLTGIGYDGVSGCQALKKEGWKVFIQDQKSSVVWGMPGAAHDAQAFTHILNLEEMAKKLNLMYFSRRKVAQ